VEEALGLRPLALAHQLLSAVVGAKGCRCAARQIYAARGACRRGWRLRGRLLVVHTPAASEWGGRDGCSALTRARCPPHAQRHRIASVEHSPEVLTRETVDEVAMFEDAVLD